ncbi:hypothetical protein FACS1894174_06640 [Bacteroidia bacterium]|nr:hypothetical protein FACS1894203_1810 [Bacteroidia bacterium]GHV22257.1 hypothetical protein FACS1894174_06640 [Bacteroidia bacterium]
MKTTVNYEERKGVVTPYNFTKEEFRAEIKKAEEGPFYTLEETIEKLYKWRKEQKKK